MTELEDLLKTLNRYADGRQSDVKRGIETPALSALLVEKYAVGLVDAVRTLGLTGIDINKIALMFTLILVLSGCADSISFEQAINTNEVGFWYGLWHGSIIPFSWFVSLFDDDVAIYAIYNNGGWYDFGYFLGLGGLSGLGFLKD